VFFAALVDGRPVQVEVRERAGRYDVMLDGRTLDVDVQETGSGFLSLIVDGRSHEVGLHRQGGTFTAVLRGRCLSVELVEASRGSVAVSRKAAAGPARITAPMPGRIVRVLIQPDQEVRAGDGMLVMEAMKMENELRAPRAGRVRQLEAREGQAVETGALLVVLE